MSENEYLYGVYHVSVDGWGEIIQHSTLEAAKKDYSTCGMNCCLIRRNGNYPWEAFV